MLRRRFGVWLAVGALTMAGRASAFASSLRGKLVPGSKPTLTTPEGPVALTGDAGTMLVLGDARLAGFDLEVIGETAGEPGVFRVGPIHKRSLLVHQKGKALLVTYWCEVCSIRTYTPGVCMCCQDDTAVDLREKLESDDLGTR
jgi:hypothetical protein